MATYNQHPDEDRDYRGRNQSYSNRDWNNRFDENRRGQQRWQDQDASTRGVGGNDGYRSDADDRRNDWDRSNVSSADRNRSGLSSNDQSWRRSQDEDSRRYGSPSNQSRSSYGSPDYSSRSDDRSRGYGQPDQNRWRSNDNDADRGWSAAEQDRSRSVNGVYGRSADMDGGTRGGYGSSYGQQAYTSGSDPNAYGRSDQNNSWAGRRNDDESRWSRQRRDDDVRSSYDQRSNPGYSQGYYDADENGRYRSSRDHDHDRHDRDEHRGFFGRMADRVSDWFSDDEDHDNQNRGWDSRDNDRRYY